MNRRRQSMAIILFGLTCLLAGVSLLSAEVKNVDTGKQKYLETVLFQQDFESYPVGEKKIEDVNGYPEDALPDVAITDQAYRTSKRALKVTLHPELKKDHSLNFTNRFPLATGSAVNISLRVKLQDIKGGQPWQTPLIRVYFYDKKNAQADYVDLLSSTRTTEAPADDNWVTISREIPVKENYNSGILSLNIYDGHDVGGAVYLDDIKITQKTPSLYGNAPTKTLDEEPDLLVLEPKEYEVFQRSTKQQGYVRVSGKTRLEGNTAELKISGKSLPVSVSEKWQQIPFDSATKSFKGTFPIAPGGWYQVDIRILKNTKEIARKTIEKVGVGEVFVCAGQSNSTNCGDEKLAPNTGMVATFSGTDWRLANDPQPGVQDETTGGSPWPAFGDAMFEKYGVPIGIASTGCGGTRANQWTINYKLFNGLMTRISQLGHSGFRAVLWHQGESDVLTGTSSQDYFDTLFKTIIASNEKAGWKFPWFVAHAAYCCSPNLSLLPIRNAQEKLWQTKIALEGPDTDLLLGDNRNAGGYGIHLSGKGLRAHGKMWAEKVAKYLDELP